MPRWKRQSTESVSYTDILWFAALAFAATWFLMPRMKTLTMSAEERAAIENSVTYSGCNEVRALGKDPIYAGEPGYRTTMDGDGDGEACEPFR